VGNDYVKGNHTSEIGDDIIIIIIMFCIFIQSVPLATEPDISLIILPLMIILQRNLKRTYLTV